MRLVCIMPARNEDWILGLTARAVLMWADELIVLNHASTDRTEEIVLEVASEHPQRVGGSYFHDGEWTEMEHRQWLLERARERGATHIATIDADEVLTGNLLPTIRSMYESLPAHATLQLPWQCVRNTIYEVHAFGVWGQAFASAGFIDEANCHWSSAERGGYQYHHRHPMGRALVPFRPVGRSQGGLLHLQFLDDRRLRAKQCLYKLQEVARWPGRQTPAQINATYDLAVYGQYTPNTAHHLAVVPREWWHPYDGLMQYLKPDAEPWQEAECKRLWAEHGAAKFAGLDLFGVV
jgi:hypothetical protein